VELSGQQVKNITVHVGFGRAEDGSVPAAQMPNVLAAVGAAILRQYPCSTLPGHAGEPAPRPGGGAWTFQQVALELGEGLFSFEPVWLKLRRGVVPTPLDANLENVKLLVFDGYLQHGVDQRA
jgi:hypothetical protein